MLGKFRPHLSYANVMATIAVFLALGGGAYAAATVGSSQIKSNAILSRHIKNGQVKNADLAANSVGGGKIVDGSVGSPDLGANSVGADKIIDGSIANSDLGPNSVGTDKLADGSIGNPKLAPNSVSSEKVLDGSLKAQDFAPGAVPSDHYAATLDPPSYPDSNYIQTKTLFQKGPLRLYLECLNDIGGGPGAEEIVHVSTTVKATVTTANDPEGQNGFGRAGTTVSPPNGSSMDAGIASISFETAFTWFGGAPISIITADTSIDGVLSYGVNGYHTCEASFFGGGLL
jgi:hypothetical protein